MTSDLVCPALIISLTIWHATQWRWNLTLFLCIRSWSLLEQHDVWGLCWIIVRLRLSILYSSIRLGLCASPWDLRIFFFFGLLFGESRFKIILSSHPRNDTRGISNLHYIYINNHHKLYWKISWNTQHKIRKNLVISLQNYKYHLWPLIWFLSPNHV